MNDSLRDLDIKYLWHPCTEINALEAAPFPIIEKAQGAYLYEIGGRPLLDGIASWWCVNLGHGHPRLIEAIRRQAGQLQHAILGGMSHPNAIRLAEAVAGITPGDLQHSFFCSDGASAVEAALKMAVQYWANIGEKGRTRFVGLEEGYHGDTLGAMGVGYVESFHKDYGDVVKMAYHATSPHCLQCPRGKHPESCSIECFDSMEELVAEHSCEIAAVVVEPLCQAAAGIRIYPEEYLRKLRRLCDKHGIILIADEIAVGFGRTGDMFACERAGIVPDIMTIGKGITGGYMPLSAAVANERVYSSFRNKGGGRDNTFWHSHTFGGNPIIASLALESISVYEDEHVLENCRARSAQLARGMEEIAAIMDGSSWQSLGLMGVVEIAEGCGGVDRARRIVRKAYETGLFLRPRGRAVYLWPPLTLSEAELEAMLSILRQSAQTT
jgi:adenosylmethionine---8-amino-7-oxononanoate aminotransferase